MEEEKKKSRLHINIGGLIVLIILALLLFKVDLKSKIQSPQFQKNITYITDQIKGFYTNISDKIKTATGDMFIDVTNKGLEKIQTNFSENILKTQNIEDLEN